MNAFKNLKIIIKHSEECEFEIDPIAIIFIVNFGILLLIQFISMLYHRMSTLTHILAKIVIFESYESKRRKRLDDVIRRMTSPEYPVPKPHKAGTDKEQEFLNENRIMEPTEPIYESLEDMAMDLLSTIERITPNENRMMLNVINALKGSTSIKTNSVLL